MVFDISVLAGIIPCVVVVGAVVVGALVVGAVVFDAVVVGAVVDITVVVPPPSLAFSNSVLVAMSL